jgi:hypothetical protein
MNSKLRSFGWLCGSSVFLGLGSFSAAGGRAEVRKKLIRFLSGPNPTSFCGSNQRLLRLP